MGPGLLWPPGDVEADVLQFTKSVDENKLGRGVAFPGSKTKHVWPPTGPHKEAAIG